MLIPMMKQIFADDETIISADFDISMQAHLDDNLVIEFTFSMLESIQKYLWWKVIFRKCETKYSNLLFYSII